MAGVQFKLDGANLGAEDVVQVAFLQAFRAITRCDPERPFRPWLLGIVAGFLSIFFGPIQASSRSLMARLLLGRQ